MDLSFTEVIILMVSAAEVIPWTQNEAHAFLAAAKGHTWYPAFVLLLYYGLRRGEVLGLSWSDIDFERGCIHVWRQNQRNRITNTLELAPVKTSAGRRDLPLLNIARSALEEHRKQQAAAYLQNGVRVKADGPVFAGAYSGLVEASVLVRSFHRLRERENIRRIKVHEIRHTTATLLKSLGVPVRDAQLILGHARITTTQEIYEHDTFEERRASLEKLEKFLTSDEDEPLPV
jgi:integrase